jgi:hypothetical protein
VAFSPVLQISKYCGFGFDIFEKFQEPPNPVQKLGLLPWTCIDIKFYNKFSIGAKFYN